MPDSKNSFQSLHQHYYPHIDGIRTLAVLPIVLYHLFAPICPGGYIGVDIFFVISGYLITQGILSSHKKNGFTISQFYNKRIRRIIPAYGVLIFFVLISSLFLYIGDRLLLTLVAAEYSAVFSTNFFFFFNSGYFDDKSTNNPLLHLWSLGVEEQFYLLIPLMMLLCFKKSVRLAFWLLLLLAVLSFAASILSNVYSWDSFNFFMLPTRAWELLAGALLAFIPLSRSEGKASTSSLLSLLGLLLCVVPFYTYHHQTLFPGITALPPILGTLLLIRFADKGIVASLLKSSPCVGIGKISYSLYLWHWPLIVYWNYYTFYSTNVWGLSSVLILSFIFAYLSWRYIEMPIRLSSKWTLKKGMMLTACVSMTVICSGLLLTKNSGISSSIGIKSSGNLTQRNILEGLTLSKRDDFPKSHGNDDDTRSTLTVLGEDEAARYVLLGDSHARHLVLAFHKFSLRNGVNGLFVNTWNLMARYVYIVKNVKPLEYNASNVENILSWLTRHPSIEYVIISNRLPTRVEGYENEPPQIKHHLRYVGDSQLTNGEQIMRKGMTELCKAIKTMGKKVLIIAPTPEQGFSVPLYVNASKHPFKISPSIESLALTYEAYQKRTKRTMALLEELEKKDLASIIHVHDFFFPDKGKSQIIDKHGEAMYEDSNHLTPRTAESLLQHLEARLKEEMNL